MLALRIGDCIITLLHLNEPLMPSQSTFDINMRKWHYAYSITGNHGKQTLMQRRMIEGLEKVLNEVSIDPYKTV